MLSTFLRPTFASIALTMVATSCASTPDITTGGQRTVLHIIRSERETHEWLGLTVWYDSDNRYWLYADNAVGLTVGGAPLPDEQDIAMFVLGSGLKPIAEVRGRTLQIHRGWLLIGDDEYGPVDNGDTIELTTLGDVVVAGEHRGRLPQ